MKDKYKFEPHNFQKFGVFYKPICVKCGLIRLSNKLTNWAVDKGCDYNYHPNWSNKRNDR